MKEFLTQSAGVMETDPEVAKDHQEAFRLYKVWAFDDRSGWSESELNYKTQLKNTALVFQAAAGFDEALRRSFRKVEALGTEGEGGVLRRTSGRLAGPP